MSDSGWDTSRARARGVSQEHPVWQWEKTDAVDLSGRENRPPAARVRHYESSRERGHELVTQPTPLSLLMPLTTRYRASPT